MYPDKNELPPYSAAVSGWGPALQLPRRSRSLRVFGVACLAFIVYAQWTQISPRAGSPSSPGSNAHGLSIEQLEKDLETCARLHHKPADPIGHGRTRNERYVDGHRPTLIRNATVWTGEPAEDSGNFTWITADVFIEHGLIKQVSSAIPIDSLPGDVLVYDAKGRPLTSGIIDMHSHAGVHSLPTLHGNEDVSELSKDVTPYVRSVDGIQPMDRQLQVIKSGGVTTSLILPGSSSNIGGEAFAVKHAVGRGDGRNETGVYDMLADPGRAWRHMKMACGENAKQVHGKAGERGPYSRLGESWEFRRAFEQAARLKREQEDWCRGADEGFDGVKSYLPYELEWEALVGVLSGQVHVHVHCYTVNDLEAFVDHTNEFGFPVRAFHHAHQTYLVPEILKRAYGDNPPASALFADNMWYKAEAALGSEHAGKILHDAGLTPIYVSDNPVLNAQHVVFEAAKAYRYGLPYHAALASVTSAPAERLGLGQRLGKVRQGFDADVVVWDSDPLSVGATPVQVWIDGAAQYEKPVELDKTFEGTIVPDESLGNIDEELVDLDGDVVFTGISKVLLDIDPNTLASDDQTYNLAISNGRIACLGRCDSELQAASSKSAVISLKNGYLTPAFTAFGSTLGLNVIETERDTDNGADGRRFSRGVDGLALDNEKVRVARRYGVSRAISAPKFAGISTHHGTSAGFSTGAETVLDPGAVFARDAAVHYTLDLSAKRGMDGVSSMSAAVGELRDKLLGAVASLTSGEKIKPEARYSESAFLRKVVEGKTVLAVTVHSADTIAALLDVKAAVEEALTEANPSAARLRLVVVGGAEAHLIADHLAKAGVGVVLAPAQSFAMSWDQRGALTGAPLTNGTAIDVLVGAGVVTAIGLEEDWIVRDLALLAGVAYQNGGGRISEKQAVALISGNIYRMLGLDAGSAQTEFVVYEGSPFEIGSRIKAVGGGKGSDIRG
ncbi:carbohydrate esterase family 9 protein [Colletotrichum plurivorum]|uniref:Carbohydrate esterase family 9 protein n=1 Tax=Colletotrichum plurivorum TaxID=2175906 RepID=A0A8H6JNX3_9PEZI|nr:carbohydrate esterase family 9 protein [Colletotrichum plurivorum]